MKIEQAREAALRLLRPFGVTDQTRIEFYAEFFAQLKDEMILYDAITGVIATHTSGFPPTIGQVNEAYASERRRASQPALPEPELTDEQRKENIRKAHILVEHAAGHMDLDEALQEIAEGGDHVEAQ